MRAPPRRAPHRCRVLAAFPRSSALPATISLRVRYLLRLPRVSPDDAAFARLRAPLYAWLGMRLAYLPRRMPAIGTRHKAASLIRSALS